MLTDQSHTSHTGDPLAPWRSNGIQRSVVIESEAAALFLRMNATGCNKNDPLLKKG